MIEAPETDTHHGAPVDERPALSGHPGLTPALWIVLALLAAIAPFSTDLYLPTFPQMAESLGTDATGVQLTLTSFLIGIALGQLAFGPLSDRLGRRWPLIAGAVVCVVSSAAAAMAPTITVLVAARFVQGFCGAAGMVIGRAIVSDVATGREAARGFSLMMVIIGVAPIVAPLAGSLLASPFGWRGILWTVCAIAAVMLVCVVLFVHESHPPRRRHHARAMRARTGPTWRALLSRDYLGYVLAFSFAFAAMMAYISASPFVFQVMAGLGTVAYGALFGGVALVTTASGAVSARLAASQPTGRLLGAGLGTLLCGSAALLSLAVLGVPALWLAVPLVVAIGSMGFVLGNATTLALAAAPHATGTASALLGALQFALGAAVAPLVSIAGEHTAVPFAIVMTTAALLAVVAYLAAAPPARKRAGGMDPADDPSEA